jgi:hypothetical protein
MNPPTAPSLLILTLFMNVPKNAYSFTNRKLEPQPDNREFEEGGPDEACLGVLNNIYQVSTK